MEEELILFKGKLKFISTNIVSEEEKRIQFNLLFKEYIDSEQYIELYNNLSYVLEDPPDWLEKSLLLNETKNVIEQCNDEMMLIEFIDLGSRILKKVLQLPPSEIPTDLILNYYMSVGDKYWNLRIFDTAIRAFEDALFIMKRLNSQSENMLKLIMRMTKYKEQLNQFHEAAQKSFVGYELATKLQNSDGWIEAFAKHVEDNNLVISRVYAYAAQASIWDNDEKIARNNIIRAIQALAEIILVQNTVNNLNPLISTIINTFRTFRIIDQADNEVILILRSILTNKEETNLLDVSKGLIEYCKLAYIPVIYTIMVITDSGSLAFSKDFERVETKTKDDNNDLTLFDEMGKNLYSGLFSAISMSMKQAIGSDESVNSVAYAGKVMMIAEATPFICYLLVDRETYEIRSALNKFSEEMQVKFNKLNQIILSSRTHMEEMIEPLFTKYFPAYT